MKNAAQPSEPKKMAPTAIWRMVRPLEILAINKPMVGANTSHHAQ